MLDNLAVEGLDFTFLATAFAFNSVLSVADSTLRSVFEYAFSRLNRKVLSIQSDLRPDVNEQADLSFEVDGLRERIAIMMERTVFSAKVGMVFAAVVSVLFMLIPYTARIMGTLMLVLPFCVLWAVLYSEYLIRYRLNQKKFGIEQKRISKSVDSFVQKTLSSLSTR